MALLDSIRTFFGGESSKEPRGYEDFPNPEAQAAADEAENQNIYGGYHSGGEDESSGGNDFGGDEGEGPDEGPDEEPADHPPEVEP